MAHNQCITRLHQKSLEITIQTTAKNKCDFTEILDNEIVVFGDLNSEIRTEQKQAKLNEKYGYYISLNSVQMTNAQSRRQREMVIPQGQTSEETIFIVFNLTRAFLHPVFLILKVVRSDFRMLIY